MARSDRETLILLRHQVQTCQSTQRQVHRQLGVFADHLMLATETLPDAARGELLMALARVRLLLNGGAA